MEYYGLRNRGDDIDLVVSEHDYLELGKVHQGYRKDIFGDLGIVKEGYEVWRTIMMFGYDHLSLDAVEFNGLLVASM